MELNSHAGSFEGLCFWTNTKGHLVETYSPRADRFKESIKTKIVFDFNKLVCPTSHPFQQTREQLSWTE